VPSRDRYFLTVAFGHLGRVGLDLMAAFPAPDDQPDLRRRRVAEAHRRPAISFIAGVDRPEVKQAHYGGATTTEDNMGKSPALFPIVLALSATAISPRAGAWSIQQCETISQSGSDILVNKIALGTAGGACLFITASYVTIDLQGFTITTKSSLAPEEAIAANRGLSGITVRKRGNRSTVWRRGGSRRRQQLYCRGATRYRH
jgi:hypothetical protein